jgi:hypothetical protein
VSPNRLVLATALLAAAVAGCSHPHQAPRATPSSPAPGTTGTSGTTASGPATFPGPDGEQAR